MAIWTYDESLRRLLASEGGYSNHPSDPGGPTNFGITIADYRKYVKPNAIAADVRAMRVDEAKRIYRAKYWDAQKCDSLPAGVDYAVFDYGVNSGIGRSGKVLRRVMGMDDSTSVVTSAVIDAARSRDPVKLVNAICDERIRFLQRLSTWKTFGGGWGPRVASVRAVGTRMATTKERVPDPIPETAPGKGKVPEPQVTPPSTGGGGIVVVTWMSVFREWVVAHPIEAVIIAIIAIGGIVLMARKVAKIWRNRSQEAVTPGTVVVPSNIAVSRLMNGGGNVNAI